MAKNRLALLLLIAVSTILAVWRWTDTRSDLSLWAELVSHQPDAPNKFDLAMIAGIPEPAQRFFRFAIQPGTPLYTVAEISMEGDFSLGSKDDPDYMPMRAKQVLAAPYGFVWMLHAGKVVPISGSDATGSGRSWSRFWLLGIVPVARAGNNEDHLRSAFGRYVAETVFWAPAALLPGNGIRWDPIDDATVRVTVTHRGLEQSVDLSVAEDGKLKKIIFQRWSNANPSKTFQQQPFGGYLSDYQEFSGFRLPTRIEAGNFFETDDYFPFFRVNVTSIRFPGTNND